MEEEKAYDLAYLELLSGKENMERDWNNFLATEESQRPRFRVYQWKEITLSLGYSQEPINLPIPVVKRPTGGGALLHGWDLSFSYTALRKDWGNSFSKIYLNFMDLLLELLKEIDPAFDMSRYRGGYEGYFCYFYPTLGEISFRGKKIVACAMRMGKEAFLLHGSLFLDMDYAYFESLTGIEGEKLRKRIITFKELGLGFEEVIKLMGYLKNKVSV
ncbi:MAG: lipoyl protein ligase domain-containing protein [Aquificaceae bacterium]